MWEALRELVDRRDLLLELASRDLRIRYKQTLLGAAWAIFTPLVLMVVFTQLFTRVARIDVGDAPYSIYVYCGLLPWQFFSASVKGAVESLTRNSRLVTKIYMPREVFPLSQIVSAGVDFSVASFVLAGQMVHYGVRPGAMLLLLPVVLAVQLLFTSGVCLLASMGNLFFRDVKYLSEVALMLWMFATSVVYPVPTDGRWGWLLALNPMTPIIDSYRQILLYNAAPDV